MSRIEAEAQEVLLRRRRSLSQMPALVPAADPGARWADYEAVSAPPFDLASRELADIDAALDRIAHGSYGRCLACGGPMGLQRLRAIPEARYCMACSGQRHASE